MFTEKELSQINQRGISTENARIQLKQLVHGNILINLIRPAIVGDGIKQFNDEQINKYQVFFDKNVKNKKILKFVPASGSASRMFKSLFNFLDAYQETEKDYLDFIIKKGSSSIQYFLNNLKKLAIFSDLEKKLYEQNFDFDKLLEQKKFKTLIHLILYKEGLNLGFLPKALVKFHKYPDEIRTALDEHMVEASMYAKNNEDNAHLHFTVLEPHLQLFKNHLAKYQKIFEDKYLVKYTINFSLQHPSTDTIAIDEDGNIFKDEQNNILFRPGGHGSLINNLHALDADVIFIKNIDNITPDRIKKLSVPYKKLMASLLIEFQQKAHQYLKELKSQNTSDAKLDEIANFISINLGITVRIDKTSLFSILNRPIRVCAMVINKGEPGGGPFWTKDTNGKISLQIVEKAQINLQDDNQQTMLKTSTHFNPTDMVCSIKNYLGKKFNLSKFIDKKTSFVTQKSFKGKKLIAIEHPGLWNGSMANWNTIFVEVPIKTFNPVKTISDLFLPSHIR